MENIVLGKSYSIKTGACIKNTYALSRCEITAGLTNDTALSVDYNDGCWCRFYKGMSRSIIIDLEKQTAVNGFEIFFLQNKSVGIYTPKSVELDISDNGVDFMNAYSVDSIVLKSTEEACISPFKLVDATCYKARFIRLTFDTDVFAYACSFKVFGYIPKGDELCFTPSKNKPKAVGMAKKHDGFSSTVLLHYGYRDGAVPYGEHYVKNTPDMLLPFVGYISEKNTVTDTMFDSVTFAILQSRAPSGGKAVYFSSGTAEENTAVKSDFDFFIQNLFQDGYNMDALDQAYALVKDSLSLSESKKLNVTVQLPFVYKTSRPFGDINGDGTDELSFTPAQRLAVYEYYMDGVISNFAKKDYKNITLAGFYQGCESVPVSMSEDEFTLFALVNSAIHKRGLKSTWMPCFLGVGFEKHKELGFDFTYLQPNYMFHGWKRECLSDFAKILTDYGLGAEIEINHTCVDSESELFEKDRQKYIDCLDFGAKHGYMNTTLAFYQGADPDSFYTAAASDDKLVRNLYDRTYRFIKGVYDIDAEALEEEKLRRTASEKAKEMAVKIKDTTAKKVKSTAKKAKEQGVKLAKSAKELPDGKKIALASVLGATVAAICVIFSRKDD